MRFCDREGFFGPGNYFAEKAHYSTHGYEHTETDGDLKGSGSLFLAKVIIGDALAMTKKKRKENLDLNKGPPVPGDPNGRTYDSIYGNDEMYVVYSNLACYPQYYVYFSK
jgi:hypothetical protein